MNPHDAAVRRSVRRYLQHGWKLVPIPAGSKAPRHSGWNQRDNTLENAEQLPLGANVGIAHAYSGTAAIDVDKLDEARQWLGKHDFNLDTLLGSPDAVQIVSGRPNRCKLLYRLPDGLEPLPTKKVADGALELRCASGNELTVQDVLPPSIHPVTGKPYTWGGSGDWRQLPVLPAQLLKLWQSLAAPPARARSTPSSLSAAETGPVREGNRNSYLTSRAGSMRRRGMGHAAIEAALLAENSHRCEPPLPDDEVRRIADSVARYEPGPDTWEEWPDPKAIDREALASEPYPLDALPEGVRAAVGEYQAYGQQPMPLVASSALAVVSLATQGLADVARDEQLRGPISLDFLMIAQSGERKTAADRAFGQPLEEWERSEKLRRDSEIKRNKAELAAWAAEEDGIKTALRSAVQKKPEEAERLRQRLMEHAESKPRELGESRLRYEDTNPQALASALANGHPSAALWSDEGGMVTGSHGMGKDSFIGFLAILNRLWDGGAVHHDRKQAQSVHVEGRRLTVSLMVQPDLMRELLQRNGGLTRGSGFLARYLIVAPVSTMGSRIYRTPPDGMPHLEAFRFRISKLLDTPLPLDEQGRLDPPLLRLSPEAFEEWRQHHDDVERELRPLGNYATIRDFAAKSAENAARIAGCLQVFEGGQGAISADTMRRAVRLARWYLHETLRALGMIDEPQAWSDARLLDAWLQTVGDVSPREVQNRGPNPLRDKGRRNAAIQVLEDLGRVRIDRFGQAEMLVNNPALNRTATATVATTATDPDSHQDHGVAEVPEVAVAVDLEVLAALHADLI